MKVLLKQNWKCKVNITSMKHKWKLGSLLWEDSPTPLETGPFFLRLYWTMRSRHCFLGKLFQYLRPVSQTSKFSGEISGAFQTSPRNGEAGKARFGITRSFSRSGFRWSDVLRWSVSGGIWPPGRQGFFAADFSSSEKKKLHGSFLFFGKFHIFFFWGGTSKLKRFEQISLNFQVLVGALQIKYWLGMVGDGWKTPPSNFDNTHDFGEGWWRNFQASSGKPGVGSSFFPGKTTFF